MKQIIVEDFMSLGQFIEEQHFGLLDMPNILAFCKALYKTVAVMETPKQHRVFELFPFQKEIKIALWELEEPLKIGLERYWRDSSDGTLNPEIF